MPKTVEHYVLTIEERMLATMVCAIWRAIHPDYVAPASLFRLLGDHPISQSQMMEARNTLKNLAAKVMSGRTDATDRDIRLWFDATLNVVEALQRALAP